MTRRAAVVKVQIARRDLGLDETTYRAMLTRITGQSSSSACTDAQLGAVLNELKAKGWKPKVIKGGRTGPATRAKPAAHPVARKARAMWISLHQLGVVRDPSEKALEAFARRQLGVDAMQWAVASDAYALIEALKGMANRAGWSQDLSDVPPHRHIDVLKDRLARAIAAREAANA